MVSQPLQCHQRVDKWHVGFGPFKLGCMFGRLQFVSFCLRMSVQFAQPPWRVRLRSSLHNLAEFQQSKLSDQTTQAGLDIFIMRAGLSSPWFHMHQPNRNIMCFYFLVWCSSDLVYNYFNTNILWLYLHRDHHLWVWRVTVFPVYSRTRSWLELELLEHAVYHLSYFIKNLKISISNILVSPFCH